MFGKVKIGRVGLEFLEGPIEPIICNFILKLSSWNFQKKQKINKVFISSYNPLRKIKFVTFNEILDWPITDNGKQVGHKKSTHHEPKKCPFISLILHSLFIIIIITIVNLFYFLQNYFIYSDYLFSILLNQFYLFSFLMISTGFH